MSIEGSMNAIAPTVVFDLYSGLSHKGNAGGSNAFNDVYDFKVSCCNALGCW